MSANTADLDDEKVVLDLNNIVSTGSYDIVRVTLNGVSITSSAQPRHSPEIRHSKGDGHYVRKALDRMLERREQYVGKAIGSIS